MINCDSPQKARAIRDEIIQAYEPKKGYGKALRILDEGFEDAILNEPMGYHIQLRTTNFIERMNSEIRRRERAIRIFPHIQSASSSDIEVNCSAAKLICSEKWF